MTTVSWQSTSNGNWRVAGNWGLSAYSDAYNFYIGAPGNYAVTVDGSINPQLITFNAAGALLKQKSTAHIKADHLAVQAGTVALTTTNTFATGVEIDSAGTLKVGATGALGAGPLYLVGGTLLGTANATVSPQHAINASGNSARLSGNFTIAAAKGTTLNFNPKNGWELDESSGNVIKFGTAKATGTVLWHTSIHSQIPTGQHVYGVEVVGGTLKAADSTFGFLGQYAFTFTIDKGATVDLAGHDLAEFDSAGNAINNAYPISSLAGEGTITSHTAAKLAVRGGAFGGKITGAVSLHLSYDSGYAQILQLTGKSNFTGGTVIGTSEKLEFVGGGSIVGKVKLLTGSTLALYQDRATMLPISISGSGDVDKGNAGTVTISKAMGTYMGTVSVSAGTLALSHPHALEGTFEVNVGGTSVSKAELLALTNMTLHNNLVVVGPVATIAAATGKTLTINSVIPWYAENTLKIGATGQKGTVVWHTAANPLLNHLDLEIVAGKLIAGDDRFENLTKSRSAGVSTTIDKGATLDLNGHDTEISALYGSGTITSKTAATLWLGGGDFQGSITGGLALQVGDTTQLEGSNSHTGATLVYGILYVGNGGTTGSLGSATQITINNTSAVIWNRSDAVVVSNAIHGIGNLAQGGSGTLTLTRANDFAGAVFVDQGTLILANAGAIAGASGVYMGGTDVVSPELRVSANVTIASGLQIRDSVHFAATSGHTLTLSSAVHWVWYRYATTTGSPPTLSIGNAGQSGTVMWNTAPSATSGSPVTNGHLDLLGGTLTGSGTGYQELLQSVGDIHIHAGATLDLGGNGVNSMGLVNEGTLTNSGAMATLNCPPLSYTTLNGAITGNISVSGGGLIFTGNDDYKGTTSAIYAGATITGRFTINDTFDTGVQSLTINGAGTLIKSNGAGSIDIHGAVHDDGLLEVQQGSLVFHDSLYYTGVIHGVISTDGVSDIVGAYGAGHDTWTGGTASSVYVLTAAPDSIADSGGTDLVRFMASMTLKANSISGIEEYKIDSGFRVDFSALSGGVEVFMGSKAGGKTTTAIGTSQADTFFSSVGKDSFTGKGGVDTFIFDTDVSAKNLDTVTDFTHHVDRLEFDPLDFTALTGDWAHEFLAVKSGHAAKTALQHLIYDKSTGALWYDSDGSGRHAAVEFAVLKGHPALDGGDLFVI